MKLSTVKPAPSMIARFFQRVSFRNQARKRRALDDVSSLFGGFEKHRVVVLLASSHLISIRTV